MRWIVRILRLESCFLLFSEANYDEATMAQQRQIEKEVLTMLYISNVCDSFHFKTIDVDCSICQMYEQSFWWFWN